MKNNTQIKIIDYLSGNLTGKEKQEFESQLLADKKLYLYFKSIEETWNEDKKPHFDRVHQTQKKWREFNNKYNSKNHLYLKILKYAAIVIFVLGCGLSAIIHFSSNTISQKYIFVSAKNSTKQKIVLPDGSEVWLNAGSSIKYPEQFHENKRLVEFNGEGYFEVVKNKEKPFIVKTKSSEIEVLGTSFNVYDYENDSTKTTTLLTGKISYTYNNSKEKIYLEPNQKVTYNIINGMVKVEKIDATKSVLWLQNILSFKNDPFSVVANKIGHKYNVKVIAKDKSMYDAHFIAEFKTETINEVAKTLSLMTKQKYILRNDSLIFVKKR